jgi:hypothetical protein
MRRTLLVLVPFVVAANASGALSAQASAAAFNSTSPTGNTNLEGPQILTQELTFKTGVLKCTTMSLTGTMSGNSTSSIVLHPTYGGCKLAGQAATVTTTGCNYQFSALESGEPSVLASTSVVCKAGKAITVAKEGCTITIRPLTSISTTFSNVAGGWEQLEFASVGVVYAEAGFACASPGEHGGGKYFGWAELAGREDPGSARVEIFVM